LTVRQAGPDRVDLPVCGGLPYIAHYAATKAAVISVTRTAALAFAGRGVTSNCICPGVVETAMWQQLDADWVEIEGWETGEAWRRRTASIPLGRPEQPSDVAAVLSFLAAPDSDYMTGQAVVVDGGLNMG
jgi:meso-butanediol dehydrogenase/(S,S)-butanediol dehydrogenase/diacetyl reductase